MIGTDDTKQYFEKLYSQYNTIHTRAERNPQTILDDAITKLDKIQYAIRKCSAAILQEAGAGAEFKAVEETVQYVRRVREHVEAMLCEAMLDPNELTVAYTERRLSFQL